jgi:hypothetical protein
MLKKISTLLLATVFAFSMMTCKSKADLTNVSKLTDEEKAVWLSQQKLEDKAAWLALECIQKLESFNNDTYLTCISQSLVKAIDESSDPKDAEKFNNYNELKKSIEKVDAMVKALLRSQSAPENKGNTSPYKGYGSPNVKQVLSEDGQRFLIKEYATDETYGYTEKNPIMVGGARKNEGPQNEKRFFNSLAGTLGSPVTYKRLYSCCPFYSKNGNDVGDGRGRGMLDVYEVTHDSLKEPVKLYINMYDSDVLKVPVGGFTIRK